MTDEGGGRSPFLTASGTLINAERARIDPRKLTEYALNPDHRDGRDKALVFERVLGYNRTNAQGLLDQIRQGIRSAPATPRSINEYGARFMVDMLIRGPSGGEAVVRTGWIYRPGQQIPDLTSAYIPRRRTT